MTLEKALEILNDLLKEQPWFSPNDTQAAVKLGIEALKYYQETRPKEVSTFCPLLPGETKD